MRTPLRLSSFPGGLGRPNQAEAAPMAELAGESKGGFAPVRSSSNIRCQAASLLLVGDGIAVGTLCLIPCNSRHRASRFDHCSPTENDSIISRYIRAWIVHPIPSQPHLQHGMRLRHIQVFTNMQHLWPISMDEIVKREEITNGSRYIHR